MAKFPSRKGNILERLAICGHGSETEVNFWLQNLPCIPYLGHSLETHEHRQNQRFQRFVNFRSVTKNITWCWSGSVLAKFISTHHENREKFRSSTTNIWTLHRPPRNQSRWYVYQSVYCSHWKWRRGSWSSRKPGEASSAIATQLDRPTRKDTADSPWMQNRRCWEMEDWCFWKYANSGHRGMMEEEDRGAAAENWG